MRRPLLLHAQGKESEALTPTVVYFERLCVLHLNFRKPSAQNPFFVDNTVEVNHLSTGCVDINVFTILLKTLFPSIPLVKSMDAELVQSLAESMW